MIEPVYASQMQAIEAGGVGEQLDRLDVLVSKLGNEKGKDALAILTAMDAIDARLEELKQSGANVKAEQSQFETSCAILKKKPGDFLRAMGGSRALVAERSKRNPPQAAWWWYLDEIRANQQKAALKRVAAIAAISLAVLGVLALVYQRFLAPSPEVVARYEALTQSATLAGDGNVAAAQAALQKGLAAMPQDPELWVMEGVLQQLQGDPAQQKRTAGRGPCLTVRSNSP
jgi:cytochrome c-type biogenesis protein CcmH/NrfG